MTIKQQVQKEVTEQLTAIRKKYDNNTVGVSISTPIVNVKEYSEFQIVNNIIQKEYERLQQIGWSYVNQSEVKRMLKHNLISFMHKCGTAGISCEFSTSIDHKGTVPASYILANSEGVAKVIKEIKAMGHDKIGIYRFHIISQIDPETLTSYYIYSIRLHLMSSIKEICRKIHSYQVSIKPQY